MAVVLQHDDWKSKASVLDIETRAFIDGDYVGSEEGDTFECVSPRDGKVLAEVASCGERDVDKAVLAARKAFESGVWSELHPKERKRILLRLARLIEEHTEELALLETLDMGKPISDSLRIDVPASVECMAWFAETADKVYDEVAPTGSKDLALITREPMGVVGAVIPWNFPLLMACWKLGPALVTGNSVVLKPAEQSPLTAIKLAGLAAEAGLPAGVLNVVPGFGEKAGRAIGLHGEVDCVSFTGSAEVGKLFMQYSGASNMKRISLECGGKTPQIVFPDCPDLDRVAEAVALGIFFNQGEVCNAGSRLLVHSSVQDELTERILEWAKRMQPDDPLLASTRMGAIVDAVQLSRIERYVQKGIDEGGRLLIGGKRVKEETGGYFYPPTVFDEVRNDMVIAQEEIFGPVLSILTFKEPEEAVRIANDTIYGLAASVWTKDVALAHKTARALRAGVVWVNCFDRGCMATPFGGYKQSGFGRDRSLHALDKYTELKTTWIRIG